MFAFCQLLLGARVIIPASIAERNKTQPNEEVYIVGFTGHAPNAVIVNELPFTHPQFKKESSRLIALIPPYPSLMTWEVVNSELSKLNKNH